MTEFGNKKIFSYNLKYYLAKKGISRRQLCEDLGFTYSAVADWYHGRKYPRIDKIELMARYFGCQKSDLIENKTNSEKGIKILSQQEILQEQIKNEVKTLSLEKTELALSLIRTLKDKEYHKG